MSTSPRTDIMVTGNSDPSSDEYGDLADFARQLERESDALRLALAAAESRVARIAQDRDIWMECAEVRCRLLSQACAEVDRLRTDLAAAWAEAERVKVENGAIHGKIGLLAERLYGINNNLPTDETIERLAQCVQGDQMRLKRMEMTHEAFDADMVDFMQKVQIGEVTCIRAAQVIEAKLTAESDHLYAIDQLTQANAALEAENRGLRSGFVAIGQKHKADSIEYIWWCGGYPKEGALVYVTRDALTEEQLASLAPKEGK